MSNSDNANRQHGDHDGEDTLESLFRHASARSRAPEDVEQAIRSASMDQWREITARRRQRRQVFRWAMAASLLLGVVTVTKILGPKTDVVSYQQIAMVEKQSGNIFVRQQSDPESGSYRLDGNQVFAGQVLSTSRDARLALNWTSGESIRVDENSMMALISPLEIELLSGRIYIDTGNVTSSGATLMIRTFAGTIQHLGTQYMAGVKDKSFFVTVREGRVQVETANARSMANPGERLDVDAAGTGLKSSVDTFGDLWAWAEQVTPGFSLDGRSAYDFVSWAGRETGRLVNFDSGEAESLARDTILRGSIDLEPVRALELILQTSDLETVVEGGTILVRMRTAD